MKFRYKLFTTATAVITGLLPSAFFVDLQANALTSTQFSKLNQTLKMLDINFENTEFKNATDFAGTSYIIGENTISSGYFVYNCDEDIITEYSLTSVSPYKNYKSNLVYGGVCSYFVLEDNKYYSTLNNKTVISTNEIVPCKAYDTNNLTLQDTPLSNVQKGDTTVNHPEFFYQDLKFNCGYSETIKDNNKTVGRCGFIALGMMIGYVDKYKNDNLMDDSFYYNPSTKSGLTNWNKNNNDYSISEYLYNLSPKDSTTSTHIKKVMNKYVEERNKVLDSNSQISIDWSSRWTPFYQNKQIYDSIKDDYPVALFGNLKYTNTLSNDPSTNDHTVVAYGVRVTEKSEYYWRCHLGWDSNNTHNYSDVYITGGTIGSIYYFWLK